jgi:hypothetical protein
MTFARPQFRAHRKAHKTVISNERWFRKGEPFLDKAFGVRKTVQRHVAVIMILSRARKRAAAPATTNSPMPTAGSRPNQPVDAPTVIGRAVRRKKARNGQLRRT